MRDNRGDNVGHEGRRDEKDASTPSARGRRRSVSRRATRIFRAAGVLACVCTGLIAAVDLVAAQQGDAGYEALSLEERRLFEEREARLLADTVRVAEELRARRAVERESSLHRSMRGDGGDTQVGE